MALTNTVPNIRLADDMTKEFAVMTRRIFKDLPISTQSEERVHRIAKARRIIFRESPSVAMEHALTAWRQERNEQQRDTISGTLLQEPRRLIPVSPGDGETFTYDGVPYKIT